MENHNFFDRKTFPHQFAPHAAASRALFYKQIKLFFPPCSHARRAHRYCALSFPHSRPSPGGSKNHRLLHIGRPLRSASGNHHRNQDYSCSTQRGRAVTIPRQPQAGPRATTSEATAGRASCAQSGEPMRISSHFSALSHTVQLAAAKQRRHPTHTHTPHAHTCIHACICVVFCIVFGAP